MKSLWILLMVAIIPNARAAGLTDLPATVTGTQVLRLPLEASSGRKTVTNDGIVHMNVVYEFGEREDRVYLESQDYPQFQGKEIYRGRIHQVAIPAQMNSGVAGLRLDIRERVRFFPAYLKKDSYTARWTQGKKVDLQTQNFFMSADKTFVIEYKFKPGLRVLELNKSYEHPELINVMAWNIDYGETTSQPGHYRNRRTQFVVTVAQKRFTVDNYGATFAAANEYYKNLVNYFKAHRELDSTAHALANLVEHQRKSLIDRRDIDDLKLVDHFLAKRTVVEPSVEYLGTTDFDRSMSQQPSIDHVLRTRTTEFAAPASDVWLLQYEPGLQDARQEFTPTYPEQIWKELSLNLGDARAVYLRTGRGLLVAQAGVIGAALTESENEFVQDFALELYGLGSAKPRLHLRADVTPVNFDERIQAQITKGVQGEGELAGQLLQGLLGTSLRCAKTSGGN